MLEKGFIKPNLTIEKIGKKQFWIGLLIGLFFAFIISHFFILSREALRSFTFINDPYILSHKQFRFYDLFFAALSSSLGFGITIICWLFVPNRNIKKNYLKIFTVSTSFFITILALAIVSRFGSILYLIVYNLPGYDNHLDILKDFWLILILIPIYIFFANWNSVRLIFKSINWILVSIIFLLLITTLIFKTTCIDRDILNQTYFSRNKERFEYIDNEINSAKQVGVYITDSTKLILQKRYAERTTDLVVKLKDAFSTDRSVSIDTLILEKIAIHNLNHPQVIFYRPIDYLEKNWSYALPEEIYYQILRHEKNDPEMKILFEILSEQISIFATKKIDWKDLRNFSNYEREKYHNKRNILFNTQTIQSRLLQVIEELKSNDKYEDYHYLIPDFEFNETSRQKNYKIEITGVNTQ
jgi:hypothetical protein